MKRLLQLGLLLATLTWCAPAHATWAMSQHRSNAGCPGTANCDVTGFSAVAAGSFILGLGYNDVGAITPTAGASGGGTWVVPSGCATQSNCGAANGPGVMVEYVLSSTGSPTTLTCQATAAVMTQCEIIVYTFTNGPVAFDVGTGGQTKTGVNPTGVSAGTLTGTNDLIVQYIAAQGTVSGCPNSATNPNDFPNGHGACGLINSTTVTAGTYTSTSGNAGAGAIAFKEAAASTPTAPVDDTYAIMLYGFAVAALVGRLWSQNEGEQAFLPPILPTVQPEMFMDSTWGAWRAVHANKPDEDEPGFLGAPAVSIVDDGEHKLDAGWRTRQYEDTDTARSAPPTPPFAIVEDGENGPNTAWSATRYDHTAETDQPGNLGPPFPPAIQDDQELQKNVSVAAPALDDDHSFNPITPTTAPLIGLDDEAHAFRLYDHSTPAVEDDLNTAAPKPPLTSDDEAATFKPAEQASRYLEEENRELPPTPPSADEAEQNLWTATAARQPDDSENYKTPTVVVVPTQGIEEIEAAFKPQEQASRITDDTATERDLPPTPPNADQDADPSLWTGQARPIVEDDQLPSPPAPVVIRTASDDEQMLWTDVRKPALEDDQRNSAPTPPVAIVDDGENKLDASWRARQHDDSDTQRTSPPTPPTVFTDDGENKINAEWRQTWHEDTETQRVIPPTPPQAIIDDGVHKHDYTWRFFLHDPETYSTTSIVPPFVQTIGRDDDVQVFSGYRATFDTQREVLVFIKAKGRSYFYLLDA